MTKLSFIAVTGGIAIWSLASSNEASLTKLKSGATDPSAAASAPRPERYSQRAADAERCASGCSLKHHPIPPFFEQDFSVALKQFAGEALSGGPGLDTLLFYGKLSRGYLDQRSSAHHLPAKHLAFLRRQLARDHARVAIRIVDQAGDTRAELPWTRVPFGEKQHLEPKTVRVQAMEFNGTVMRTGLGHIWARF